MVAVPDSKYVAGSYFFVYTNSRFIRTFGKRPRLLSTKATSNDVLDDGDHPEKKIFKADTAAASTPLTLSKCLLTWSVA